MLAELILYNLEAGCEVNKFKGLDSCFILKTCQRTIILSHGLTLDTQSSPLSGNEAYRFLLEVICGLKSRLIGENEIVSQFKKGYQDYIQNPSKSNQILVILEKLFKDAKQIRSQYLTGISQKTYASLTRKQFVQKSKAKSVLILGSGQLAQDMINQLSKHCDVLITARDKDKLSTLQNIEKCTVLAWDNLSEITEQAFICNTIGFKGVLLDEEFFQNWNAKHKSKLLVDLGSPSCIKTHFKSVDGVLRLDDIFNAGAIHEEKKQEKIKLAQEAISHLTTRRSQYLQIKKQKTANHGDLVTEQTV